MQLAFRLLVLLAELLDDFALFFDLLLQAIVLAFLLHHFLFGSLLLLDQGLLPYTLLFEL